MACGWIAVDVRRVTLHDWSQIHHVADLCTVTVVIVAFSDIGYHEGNKLLAVSGTGFCRCATLPHSENMMPHVFVFSYPIVRMSVAGFMLDCLRPTVIQGGMTLSVRKVPARQFVIFKGLRVIQKAIKLMPVLTRSSCCSC